MSAILAAWEPRLINWSYYVMTGSSQASQGVSSIYRGTRMSPETMRPQPLIGPAVDVDRLVHRLSDVHRQALIAWYCWTGNVAERARDLGCHADTLANRVRAATFALDDLDQARRQHRV